MQSELNCGVCSNEYQQDNLPRLLTSCGHTYCESCLDTMMTQQQDGRYRVSCPQDSILTYLDCNDVKQFPKNIALLKVIENKKNQSTIFRDQGVQSFEMTKIHGKEDSRGDEFQRQIISQMQGGKDFSSSRDESKSKEEIKEQSSVKKEEQFQLCLPHQKPMDIVCLQDMMKICAKCAIFGEHKGHQFKSIDQIEEQWDIFRQDIINLYSKKESIEKILYNEENAKSIWSLFEQSQKRYQKQLSDKFKKLKEYVKQAQQKANKQLDLLISKSESKVKALLKMDPIIQEEYKSWQDKSFGLILKTQECSLEEKLKNLYNYNNTRLVPQGEAILTKMQVLENEIPNQIQEVLKNISIQSDDQILYSLEQYIKVTQPRKGAEQKQKNEISRSPKMRISTTSYEQSLLESQMNQVKADHQQHYHAKTVQAFPQPEIKSYQPANTFHVAEMKSEEHQSYHSPASKISKAKDVMQGEESPVQGVFLEKSQRPTKKKLKMIKVPERYQKVLDSLYSDTLDVLDLTNAELGNEVIIQICEFLRGTKVRSVKFIRNKLTDDAIPRLVQSMGCVIILNLSQNMLTETALDYLVHYRATMPNLKSVILSQNKIIQRKHKAAIQRLRKLELTVSV